MQKLDPVLASAVYLLTSAFALSCHVDRGKYCRSTRAYGQRCPARRAQSRGYCVDGREQDSTAGADSRSLCSGAAICSARIGCRNLRGRSTALRDLHGAEWHMIGHLQTNKAARTAELFRAVDSVDSLKLAEKLNAAAHQLGRKLDRPDRNQRRRRSREKRPGSGLASTGRIAARRASTAMHWYSAA